MTSRNSYFEIFESVDVTIYRCGLALGGEPLEIFSCL